MGRSRLMIPRLRIIITFQCLSVCLPIMNTALRGAIETQHCLFYILTAAQQKHINKK